MPVKNQICVWKMKAFHLKQFVHSSVKIIFNSISVPMGRSGDDKTNKWIVIAKLLDIKSYRNSLSRSFMFDMLWKNNKLL